MAYSSYDAALKAAGPNGKVAWSADKGWYIVGAAQATQAGAQDRYLGGGDVGYWSGSPTTSGTTAARPATGTPTRPSAPVGGTAQPWMRPPTQQGMGGAGLFDTATSMYRSGTPVSGISPLFGMGEGGASAFQSWVGGLDPYEQQGVIDDMQRREMEEMYGAPEETFDLTQSSQITPDVYQMPDGSFVSANGVPMSEQMAQYLIGQFYGTGEADAEGLTELQKEQLAFQQQQMEMEWAQFEAQQALSQQQMGSEDAWRQSQIDLARQQYGAQLAAQPHSWLEYSAFTGQTPTIQPHMLPLMPQQYSDLQAGQPIPGYSPTDMSGMPELLRPSAQYFSRMGPTSQGQYLGYQQAKTGAIPEETLWRQQSAAPPSGRFAGLSRRR